MTGKSTFADWAKLAQKDLRDTPVDSLNRDYGDLPIRPAYFPEDATTDPGIPGAAPYTRGVRATMYANRPWTIRQYAGFSTARESNDFYRKNLAAGQKGLWSCVDPRWNRQSRSWDAARCLHRSCSCANNNSVRCARDHPE